VTIAGATQAGYNGTFQITVTGLTTFTFQVNSGLTTPATTSTAFTALYTNDSIGSKAENWVTVATVCGELMPLRSGERLQAQSMSAQTDYAFRVYRRSDITPPMRVSWTPSWGGGAQSLEIQGVRPDGDGRRMMLIDCGARG
jgi:head-tail adaptor